MLRNQTNSRLLMQGFIHTTLLTVFSQDFSKVPLGCKILLGCKVSLGSLGCYRHYHMYSYHAGQGFVHGCSNWVQFVSGYLCSMLSLTPTGRGVVRLCSCTNTCTFHPLPQTPYLPYYSTNDPQQIILNNIPALQQSITGHKETHTDKHTRLNMHRPQTAP